MHEKNYGEILAARKFDHTATVAPDRIFFTIKDELNDDAVIGTAGNFVAITGLPKARKSTIISALVASFITGTPVFNFQLKIHKEKDHIAVFDTEQSPYDFNRSINTIEKLSGYSRPDVFTFLDAFLLSQDEPSEILRIIDQYLKITPNCGIIVIDGLLDLIDNMNDEGSSKRLIRILKKWAKRHEILIITVLHLGKKDQNSIGHIGSASDRYAQSTLLVEKTKTGTTTITGKYLRSSGGFNPIEISWNQQLKKYIQLNP